MAESAPLILEDPAATDACGRRIALAVLAARPPSLMVFLEGDLGAGKTTFARGFLAGLGHQGRVPSPTYTLVEPYVLCGYRVYHIDLYRIRDPAELDDLGLSELLSEGALALIEWPDHGTGHVPPADVRLRLDLAPAGRALTAHGLSARGCELLDRVGN